MKPENAALARAIQRAIDDSGMTKATIAEKMGLSGAAISSWTTTGTIGKTTLRRFADLVGRDVGDFYVTEDARPKKRAAASGVGTYKPLANIAHHGEERLIAGYRALKPAAQRALIALLAALTACGTTKEARIYDLGTGDVIQATFVYEGKTGKISARLPTGEACSGEYSTLRAGAVWGGYFQRRQQPGQHGRRIREGFGHCRVRARIHHRLRISDIGAHQRHRLLQR